MAKHHIIRAARRIKTDGRVYETGDVVAHLMGDMTPRQFGGLMSNVGAYVTESRECEDLDCDGDHVADSPDDGDSVQGSPQGGTPAEDGDDDPGNGSGDTAGDGGGSGQEKPQDGTQSQGQDDGIVAALVAGGIKESTAEELAVTARGGLDAEDLVPDHEMLGSPEGIRLWIAEHKDLTTVHGIGKKRAEEIEAAVGAT